MQGLALKSQHHGDREGGRKEGRRGEEKRERKRLLRNQLEGLEPSSSRGRGYCPAGSQVFSAADIWKRQESSLQATQLTLRHTVN